MALSGSFTGYTNNEFIQPKIVWSGTQSIEGNYTDVTATLYYSRTNTGYTTSGTLSGAITINGTSTSYSKYVSLTYNSNTVVGTATTRVYHNDDGTKTITISATGAISGASLSSTTISATVTLDTIARATQPVLSQSTADLGTTITITTTPASGNFKHTVRYSFYTENETIETGVGTSCTWTIPKSFANFIPNSTSGWGRIFVDTYSGSTLIGTKSCRLDITIPSDVVPSISKISITEAVAGIADKFGAFVQNKSKLAVSITAAGMYGSTIKSCLTVIQSVMYSGASFTSNLITTGGTITVLATATDSRGRTAQAVRQITVLEYSAPVINSFSAFRIDTSGNASEDGNRIALAMNFAVSSVNELNDRTYAFKYRKTSETEFTTFASGTASTTFDDTQYFTSSPEISGDYPYVIRIEIADFFETVVYEREIPTAFTLMDFNSSGKGMAIGKVSEKNALEVAVPAEFTDGLTEDIPVSDGDCNEITASGHYYITANGTNGPVAIGGWLTVKSYIGEAATDGTYKHVYQKYITYTGDRYTRHRIDGTWGEWTAEDYIVEQGASGAWTYRKWNSGYAECWGRYSASGVNISKNSYSNFYYSEAISVDFPFTFAANPVAVYSGGCASYITFVTPTGAPTTTQAKFWICCLVSGATSCGVSVDMFAHGKWK